MTIAFDSGRHSGLLSTLDNAAAEIQEQLDELSREVTGLRTGWDGTAWDAYDDAQREWTAAMHRLGVAISRARDGASSAGERLASAETSVAALWVS